MGSKRAMLANGLGSVIERMAFERDRVVDLFSGSAAVSWFAAETTNKPVLAVDLQRFSAVLAEAVIARTEPLVVDKLARKWTETTMKAVEKSQALEARDPSPELTKQRVLHARTLSARIGIDGSFLASYGGHYFSPAQAAFFDEALRRLPDDEPERTLCRAALIAAASRCAAAPGHTAQPFQPTRTALPYIEAAWEREPDVFIHEWLGAVAPRHAKRLGTAVTADALTTVADLLPGDLVIVDPPYSAVQYSRFYHVLEAIAQGHVGEVTGAGRYPDFQLRPRSRFSLKSEAKAATEELLTGLAEVGCAVVLTFPAARCSNGLSGRQIAEIARPLFDVEQETVLGRFSTLGGNGRHRASRHAAAELVLALTPRD
jgi:16S rRNA G966 N2-methylase RsmD